jgi:hypothetical protein
LESKPENRIAICGSTAPGAGGLYAPLGYWFKENGLFYADLKSIDQLYSAVRREALAIKRLGGVKTKSALRQIVADYWLEIRTEQGTANVKA